jgi:hypothetical protein
VTIGILMFCTSFDHDDSQLYKVSGAVCPGVIVWYYCIVPGDALGIGGQAQLFTSTKSAETAWNPCITWASA